MASRGVRRHVPRPRWRCGQPGCPQARAWQPVSTVGGCDELQEALADLNDHYRWAHPELVGVDTADYPEGVVADVA